MLADNANFVNAGNNPSTTSNPPPNNLIEWQRTKGPSISAMMLPIDMQIYLSFNTNSTGGQNSAKGEYCSQGNNVSLVNCTTKNTASTQYLPLANNAPLAFSYAQSNSKFLADLIPAFLKMVKHTTNSATLTPFSPTWGCINGVLTCLGDIFFSGCPSSSISC